MFHVALCGLPNSADTVAAKMSAFLNGTAVEYSIAATENIDELIGLETAFHVCFLNRHIRESGEARLLAHLEKSGGQSGKKDFRFLTYTDDPISEQDCDYILECIRRYLEYDSMYLCVEFLTEQGLKTIAVSRVLFFEVCGRKIRIKTQNAQYFCADTLHNVHSLVSGYAFTSPHKSFIVNMRHIAGIKDYTITMSDGSLIPLSQKKSREFRALYKAYLEENNAKLVKRARNRGRNRE